MNRRKTRLNRQDKKVAVEYEKLIRPSQVRKTKDDPLLKMAGAIKHSRSDLSQNVDSIYLQD